MDILEVYLRKTHVPIVCPEDGPVRHGMKQGPVGFVAAAVVVQVKEFCLDGHRHGLLGQQASCWSHVRRIRLRNPAGVIVQANWQNFYTFIPLPHLSTFSL